MVIGLLGCAAPKSLRPEVSDQLRARTGNSLGSQTDAGVPSLPPGVALDHPLSEGDAVAIALWNNAAFLQLLSELGLARADVVVAGQITNPTFMVLFPLGPKQFEFAAKFPVEALWLRRRRVASAELKSQEVAARMVQGGLDLVRDVKLACAGLRLASGTYEAKQLTATLLKKIAALAESRFEAGDISGLAATDARIASLAADQDLKQAKADAALATVHLRSLLGLPQNSSTITLADAPQSPVGIQRGVEELAKDALANRPDLRAAELGLEAAGKRVKLARREIYTLTAILDANGTGGDFEMGPGVELPIPLFNQNQGGIAIADAQLEQAVRNYIAVRDQITMEVHQAYVRWEQTFEATRGWDDQLLPELSTAVEGAREGVRSGDLPPLQALEMERSFLTASSNRAVAFAGWQRAVAELERAIGHRLDLAPSTTASSSPTTP